MPMTGYRVANGESHKHLVAMICANKTELLEHLMDYDAKFNYVAARKIAAKVASKQLPVDVWTKLVIHACDSQGYDWDEPEWIDSDILSIAINNKNVKILLYMIDTCPSDMDIPELFHDILQTLDLELSLGFLHLQTIQNALECAKISNMNKSIAFAVRHGMSDVIDTLYSLFPPLRQLIFGQCYLSSICKCNRVSWSGLTYKYKKDILWSQAWMAHWIQRRCLKSCDELGWIIAKYLIYFDLNDECLITSHFCDIDRMVEIDELC